MNIRLLTIAVSLCVAAATTLVPVAAHDNDRKEADRCTPPPCPLPPCPPEECDPNYTVSFTYVDAGCAAIPAINAVLASSSNQSDQLAGLQAQAKAGLPIFQVSYGPALRVQQDATNTREDKRDIISAQPRPLRPLFTRSRVSAHPYQDAQGAEVVNLSVQQGPAEEPTGTVRLCFIGSLVFKNGDTKLLSCLTRPDGTCRFLYATVFFPTP